MNLTQALALAPRGLTLGATAVLVTVGCNTAGPIAKNNGVTAGTTSSTTTTATSPTTPTSPTGGTTTEPAGVEVWNLTLIEGGLTETVQVRVTATTFAEDGTGEWFFSAPPVHVHVGGTVSGNRWTFVGMSGSGAGETMVGEGSGVENATFPEGTTLQGNLIWTFQTLTGPQTVTGTWSGVRLE